MPSSSSPWVSTLRPALEGMRANLLPGLVLQAFALVVLIGYFGSAEVGTLLDQLGELKENWGYVYSACATALFGGVIPFLTLLAYGRVAKGRELAEFGFYVAFWVWKGVEVDALYRGQVVLFGDSNAVGVIAAKVALDQFVYNPVWSGPTQAAFFLWKDSGFSFRELRRRLGEQSLLRRTVVVLCSGWVVWIPAVSIVYSLPAPLQIPLFNLVLCFWCLLLTFVSRHATSAQQSAVTTRAH